MTNGTYFKVASRRNEFGEWVVLCYVQHKRYYDGDYFASDKQDAMQTCERLNESLLRQRTIGNTADYSDNV